MDASLAVLAVSTVDGRLAAYDEVVREASVELVCARGRDEALAACERHDVALILLDVDQPSLDGYEVAERLRERAGALAVPIVVVSEVALDATLQRRAYEAGAVDLLVAPLTPLLLRRKVEAFVGLARQRRELTQVVRLREQFCTVLGHDLRNPLNAIRTLSDLGRGRAEEPQLRRHFEQIATSAARMTRMIEHLLDASRLRMRGLAVAPEPARMAALVASVLAEAPLEAGRFHVEVEGPDEGRWDPDRIHQVLANLVRNAVAYSPAGSPIGIAIDGRSSDEVVVAVRNEGPPIPAALRDVLFEPFHGLGEGRGLGLGLYICRYLVDAHGGAIALVDGDPRTTCFEIRLPRHTTDGGDAPIA